MAKRGVNWLAGLAVAGCVMAQTARASLDFNLNTSVKGPNPASSSPWLTAHFDTYSDKSGSGVALTLTAGLEIPGEFISEVAFNVSGIRPKTISQYGAGPDLLCKKNQLAIETGGHYSIESVGTFNVRIRWTTANSGNRFDSGESVTFRLAGATLGALGDSTSWHGLSLLMAAKVAGIPQGKSPTSGVIGYVDHSIALASDPTPVPETGTQIAGLLVLLPLGVSVLKAARTRRAGCC